MPEAVAVDMPLPITAIIAIAAASFGVIWLVVHIIGSAIARHISGDNP